MPEDCYEKQCLSTLSHHSHLDWTQCASGRGRALHWQPDLQNNSYCAASRVRACSNSSYPYQHYKCSAIQQVNGNSLAIPLRNLLAWMAEYSQNTARWQIVAKLLENGLELFRADILSGSCSPLPGCFHSQDSSPSRWAGIVLALVKQSWQTVASLPQGFGTLRKYMNNWGYWKKNRVAEERFQDVLSMF